MGNFIFSHVFVHVGNDMCEDIHHRIVYKNGSLEITWMSIDKVQHDHIIEHYATAKRKELRSSLRTTLEIS